METRARFILIGAFTIAGFVGILAFFLWFARIELDQQFDYYDIRFSSVSGLSTASDVRFSGLPVGQVVDVRLSPDRDGTIQVRVEIASETPVRTDSIATIEAQGVTGVSFVSIGPGTPDALFLKQTVENVIPEITAGRSTLQSLSESAPALLNEALDVVQEVSDLLSGDNQGRLERILVNIENASADFAQTLNDFSAVAETVGDFAQQIDRFNVVLETLSGDVSTVMQTADATLTSITATSDRAQTLLDDGSDVLDTVNAAAAQAEDFIAQNLTEATTEVRQTMIDLQEQIAALGAQTQTLLATFDTTASTATSRLDEAETTLASVTALTTRLDETALNVSGMVARIDALIESDGGPLLAETRTLVAEATDATRSINAVIQTDLPAMVADIRTATATASEVIQNVGSDLSGASGRIDSLARSAQVSLDTATTTFRNANVTLSAINDALETGGRTLAAAERAFDGADRVINDDVAGIVTGLETTLANLNAAIADVSADLPEITQDLRDASQSASTAFEELRRTAASAGPSVQEFSATALPLYTSLAQETRTLISNLDRLTTQIERDPARFFLDGDVPEFRR